MCCCCKRLGMVVSCFGFRSTLPPKLCRLERSRPSALAWQLSPLRLGVVPHGQRSPLDADTYVLIDRPTRLVEPPSLSRACAVLQQARRAPSPRSPLATVRRRGLVVKSYPSCSPRAALSSSYLTASNTPLLKVLCVLRLISLRSCEEDQALLVWRNTSLVMDLATAASSLDIMVGVVLCRADALCRAQALFTVSIVVHRGQLSPIVAVMVEFADASASLLAGETGGRATVVKHRIEIGVKLASPTHEQVTLPTCASVIDKFLFDEVVTKTVHESRSYDV